MASVGVLWRSGGCPLFGCFGRLGVGESVGVGSGRFPIGGGLVCHSRATLRNHSGIKQPCHSQETLRKLSAFISACVCLPAPEFPNRASASASANSQIDRASAPASANSQIDLTSVGRWGSVVFTASVPSRAQGIQTSLLGARIPIRNWSFFRCVANLT